MSIGFRKSFFGFNCEDVLSYIEKSHKDFAAEEKELKSQIADLNGTISELENKISELENSKENIKAQLESYENKKAQIDQMSKTIGKLYLVAQSNARSVIKSSEDNLAAVKEEIEKNFNSIDSAHQMLDNIKSNLIKTTEEFTVNIDTLSNSLNIAKEEIKSKESEAIKKTEEISEYVNNLIK